MDSKTLGILGGGQLGRMLIEEANRMNIKTIILDGENSPAKQISNGEHINGSFKNKDDIKALAAKCDVLTIEIEHVDIDTLKEVSAEYPKLQIHPSPETIGLIKDKYLQKLHLMKNDIKVAESHAIENNNVESLSMMGEKIGYPYLLKSRTEAYDGRGNFVVSSSSDLEEALEFLKNRPLYAEKFAPFEKELAVMIIKQQNGEVKSFPVVETIHQHNICHTCYAPARIGDEQLELAKELALKTVATFPGCGIFGVEMFLMKDGDVLINEIAPRPHNSGHYTIDACVISQFEAHLRAVMGLPIPELGFISNETNAIMLNVLGDDFHPGKELELCQRALEIDGGSVYLYGKESKPKRKLGHINIISDSMASCEDKLKYVEGHSKTLQKIPQVGVIMGSDSDLPVMKAACDVLNKFDIPFEVTIVSAHRTPQRMFDYATSARMRGLKAIIAGAGGAAHLPGMVAAMTSLPVIGVPVKGSVLDGVDSMHSILQMPRGVPVATVAINNSTNAGLLAVRMLGGKYSAKMELFMQEQEKEVLEKAKKIENIGHDEYLLGMRK
ncbi:probable Phosphoribosylaminoimidazole carboxylase [Hanseniaspora guilliermondii]|uniref:Phosphoribosylaminoimidazole carboxylase n=1 Tax=Hanseniaspora guilliermondii TaxID=56406 RepID=A0A1L0CLW7_9ASCO|nr:probable Phosphoribosylaminoimidazole carboxylase [Hanseniaspora guilliermondii]